MNSEESRRRHKQRKATINVEFERLTRKKNSNKKEITKEKVEENKSLSKEVTCEKCKTTFKSLFDKVAHVCSASTSTNNSKSNQNSVDKVSCNLCNLTFNSTSQFENHQTSCNSNKNCVPGKKLVNTLNYALRSESSKLLNENRQATSSQKSNSKKANYPFLRSKDINNSNNSSVHDEINLPETVNNFNLSEDYRSDINIRKSFDKDKGIATRKKVSSKKVPVLPGDKSSFESSKVNSQNSTGFSEEMNTTQLISNKSLQSLKKDKMLDRKNINEKTETNINTTKVQIHFTRNKNMKTSDSKVQEETLEPTLSEAPSKTVKIKRKKSSETTVSSEPEKDSKVIKKTLESTVSRAPSKKSKKDIHVASTKQLNLKSFKRKKSSETTVSSEPEENSKVIEETLESTLSGVPSKIVKTKRNTRVVSKQQLNLKLFKRKKSSESIASSEPKKDSKVTEEILESTLSGAPSKTKSCESTASSEPQKNSKVISQKRSHEEIKLENLIYLLPDPQSGVLIKLLGEKENFKCVKCGKTSGNAYLGSIHIICCKASYKKNKSVILDDLVWVCTFCHNSFDNRTGLLKHKTACPYPSPSISSEEKDTEECPKELLSKKSNRKCKKCGLACLSSYSYSKHQCKERLTLMKKCEVLLEHCSKYNFDSKKITFYQCKNCKKDFLEKDMLQIHLKQCAPEERHNTIKPMYLNRRDYEDPCSANFIKREPASDLPRDSEANLPTNFNQPISFDSHLPSDAPGSLFMRVENSMPAQLPINQPSTTQQVNGILSMPSTSYQQFRMPNSHLPNTFQHSFRVPNIQQPPAPQFQFQQPLLNLNANWKSIREFIGCNCPPQNQGSNSDTEDSKPCGVCLKKLVENLGLGGKNFDSLNSESSETQEPNNSVNPRVHQTRSFPTPPKTPDNIASSSSLSLLSDSIATLQNVRIESFEDELRGEEGVAVNRDTPMEIDYAKLKLAWFDDSDIIDAFAFVKSEEDLEISRYVCARCFVSLNKEDILNHCVQHGNTNGANVSYVIQPSD